MFIDDEQTEAVAERIVQVLRALELEVMLDICRRLKLAGEITRTADYQLWRLSQISAFKGNYEKMIKNVLNLTDKELKKLYENVIAKGYARDEAIYQAANVPFTPFEENIALQQLISAVQEQTHDAIANITQTTGFIDLQRNTEVSLTQYFQNVLDKTHLEISTGTMSYDQAISKAVNDMVMSGMRSDHNGDLWIKYDNPGKKPWRNRVDVATRRAVMTGITQVTGKISDQNAEKLHTEWFEVSAHSTARPTHMIWQGKVYTKEQLYTVCGLGTGPGLLGWNCYHHYDAFLPGVSVRKWTDKQLADMRKEASVKKEYGGKKYTLYEATQRQRQLETRMRAVRQKVELLKEAGASKQMISAAKAQQKALYKEYKAFSQHFGLPEQINRVYYRNYKTAPVTVQRVENAPEIGYKEPFTDIRDEYVSINPVPPGKVTKDEGYLNDEVHKRDEATAEWFSKLTGKNIHLLKEQNAEGVHTPDAEVDGKYWEFKEITSKSSVFHHVTDAMTKQIISNPGGLILNISRNKKTGNIMSDSEAIGYVQGKLKFYQKYCSVDVIIKNGDRLVSIFRMNKK